MDSRQFLSWLSYFLELELQRLKYSNSYDLDKFVNTIKTTVNAVDFGAYENASFGCKL